MATKSSEGKMCSEWSSKENKGMHKMSKSRKGGKAFQIKGVYPLIAGKMFEDIFALTD